MMGSPSPALSQGVSAVMGMAHKLDLRSHRCELLLEGDRKRPPAVEPLRQSRRLPVRIPTAGLTRKNVWPRQIQAVIHPRYGEGPALAS